MVASEQKFALANSHQAQEDIWPPTARGKKATQRLGDCPSNCMIATNTMNKSKFYLKIPY